LHRCYSAATIGRYRRVISYTLLTEENTKEKQHREKNTDIEHAKHPQEIPVSVADYLPAKKLKPKVCAALTLDTQITTQATRGNNAVVEKKKSK
tara:strand:- start:445 stop:726 length:282 start_codon:yes stop_codon:yes gene_type:complete